MAERQILEEKSYKTVYREGNVIVKAFTPSHPMSDVYNEAFIHACVEDAGVPVPKLLGVSMRLSNPRTRMLDVPRKKLPASFAIGEWLWTIGAHEDLAFIRYYAPSYGRFSDDGVMLNGAYGPRIVPELEKIVDLIRQDPDSRRAVVPIYARKDVALDSRDIPCTTTLQLSPSMYTTLSAKPLDRIKFSMLLSCNTFWAIAVARAEAVFLSSDVDLALSSTS
jgi:hypothetical protein